MNTDPRILIVDDSPEDRAVLRRLLEGGDAPYDVGEADDARSALEALSSSTPDCVLLDFRLPDGDGLELYAQAQRLLNGEGPAFLMLTGQGDESIAVEALKAGMQDYLVKGRVDGPLLGRAVRSAIERRRGAADLAGPARLGRVFSEDLHEPLRSLRVGTALIANHCYGALDAEHASVLDDVLANARRLDRLAQSFTAYCGFVDSAEEDDVDLERVMRYVQQACHGRASAWSATVTSDRLPVVRGDARQIQMLLELLVDNALDLRPHRYPPDVAVEARRGDGLWRVTVSSSEHVDADAGEEEVTQPRATRNAWLRCSVGLALCRQIAESHGGALEVEPGGRTTVRYAVTLPAADAPQ